MLIGKAEIRRLIPHAGAMCLLDRVETWHARSIVCRSASHRDPANPLRRGNTLSAIHAFEYAGQAAAVHGGLLARERGERAPFAYLGALKACVLHVTHLHTVERDLRISVELLAGEKRGAIYACHVASSADILAAGRLMIIFRGPDNR